MLSLLSYTERMKPGTCIDGNAAICCGALLPTRIAQVAKEGADQACCVGYPEREVGRLLTAFLAQILHVLVFRVQLMEFFSAEATARNILLRAEFGVKPGQQSAVSEYLELRDFWKVTPWLETRMAGLMNKYLTWY